MSIESKLPAELQKRRTALFSELAKIAAANAALADDRAAFKALPAAELTPQSRAAAQAFPDRELQLLQSELRAIDALGEIQGAYVGALMSIQRAAVDAHEQAKVEILAKLIGLGFIDPAKDPLSPCRVLPMYVLNHPAVRAAAAEVAEIQNTPRDFPLAGRFEELQTRLAEIKARLAA